ISANKAWEQAVAHRAARILAKARRADAGGPSAATKRDVAAALCDARIEMSGDGSVHRALLKQADHLMLAGAYRDAARAYFGTVYQHPSSPLGWAKLARLGLFMALPPMRETCFR